MYLDRLTHERLAAATQLAEHYRQEALRLEAVVRDQDGGPYCTRCGDNIPWLCDFCRGEAHP